MCNCFVAFFGKSVPNATKYGQVMQKVGFDYLDQQPAPILFSPRYVICNIFPNLHTNPPVKGLGFRVFIRGVENFKLGPMNYLKIRST
jgi:hypothetical protein